MSFAISGGRLAQLDRPNLAPSWTHVNLAPRLTLDYAEIWRTQPQVRTVVSFLGRNVAQLGLKVYRRQSDVDRQHLPDHALAELLERPNPYTTRYRLVDALVQDLGIYDNAYWLKVRDLLGQPRALVRLDPLRTNPTGGNAFFAEAYDFHGGRGVQTFPADQVVHFRGYSPENAREGCSPIETLRSLLAEEYQAAQYREQMWRNGARTSGYLRRPVDAPAWSRDARERFILGWQNQYAGEGALAGGTPLLEDGMEFVSASVTPEQAQYLEARKLTREEVAAAYHIPPPMIGVLDNATYSNITEQHKILYMDTLGPWLQMLAQEIELQLLPDFGNIDRVYVEFNLSEKLRGSFDDQAAQLQASTGAPYMTRNEARAMLNLPQLPEADALVVPLNVLIGGQASPQDSAPPSGIDTDLIGASDTDLLVASRDAQIKARIEDAVRDDYRKRAHEVLADYFARQGAVISSKLGATSGRAKLGDVYDRPRWVGELTTDLFGLAVRIATAAAKATLRAFGLNPDSYDEDRTLAFLHTHAENAAEQIEDQTAEALTEALAAEDPQKAVTTLFAGYATDRAEKVARTETTSLTGFGSAEAAEKSGRKAMKTWRAHADSRPTHKALNGETVAVDDRFSNGARWPGDRDLPPEERAGCRCEMTISAT